MQIEYFLKLNQPSLSGNPLTDDPQQFIDYTNKVLRILRCPSERAGELVAYNLNGPVEQWYATLLEGRDASDLPSLTWEEFTEIFMMRFLPVNKREKYANNFEKLRQTSGMSVAEYEEQFTKLSCHAHHLLSTETMRAKRFV